MASATMALYGIILITVLPSTVVSRRVSTFDTLKVEQEHQVQKKASSNSTFTQVYANVYDLDDGALIKVVNTLLFATGGAYHVGIEAFGMEFQYGSGPCCATGVSVHNHPKQHSAHKFYKSVLIGATSLNQAQFMNLAKGFQRQAEWKAVEYDLLTKNCIVFSEALLQALPEHYSLPGWTKSLMNVGAAVLPTLGKAVGAMSKVSANVSEASVSGSQASQAEWHQVTAYAACSSQFRGGCGSFHIEGQYYSVTCPAGYCCHKYQQMPTATCVPFCPGQQDHLYSNNANGACR